MASFHGYSMTCVLSPSFFNCLCHVHTHHRLYDGQGVSLAQLVHVSACAFNLQSVPYKWTVYSDHNTIPLPYKMAAGGIHMITPQAILLQNYNLLVYIAVCTDISNLVPVTPSLHELYMEGESRPKMSFEVLSN